MGKRPASSLCSRRLIERSITLRAARALVQVRFGFGCDRGKVERTIAFSEADGNLGAHWLGSSIEPVHSLRYAVSLKAKATTSTNRDKESFDAVGKNYWSLGTAD